MAPTKRQLEEDNSGLREALDQVVDILVDAGLIEDDDQVDEGEEDQDDEES